MRQLRIISNSQRLIGLALPMVLLACGGSNTTTSSTLGGTAATGAPIVGGTVNIKCSSGADLSTTTNTTGDWQVTLSNQTLPCKLKVSGGDLPANQIYHSLALDYGTINITPVTNLVVANLAAKDPSLWFSEAGVTSLNSDAVNAALTKVREALPLEVFKTNNPLTSSFKAQKGDPLDNALEAVKTVFSDDVKRQELLNAAQSTNFKTLLQSYSTALTAAYNASTTSNSSNAGSSTSSNTGSTPSSTTSGTFACKVPEKSIRTPSIEEFNLFVKSYNGNTWDGINSSTASAELKTNGQLIVGGKTYIPTSYCFDTVIGDTNYGNTLYVFFPQGKADLWHKNSTHSTNIYPPGTTNLLISTSTNEIKGPSFYKTGMVKPTSESGFCISGNYSTMLSDVFSSKATYEVNSCSFAGNVGSINATLIFKTPVESKIPYAITFTYE